MLSIVPHEAEDKKKKKKQSTNKKKSHVNQTSREKNYNI